MECSATVKIMRLLSNADMERALRHILLSIKRRNTKTYLHSHKKFYKDILELIQVVSHGDRG